MSTRSAPDASVSAGKVQESGAGIIVDDARRRGPARAQRPSPIDKSEPPSVRSERRIKATEDCDLPWDCAGSTCSEAAPAACPASANLVSGTTPARRRCRSATDRAAWPRGTDGGLAAELPAWPHRDGPGIEREQRPDRAACMVGITQHDPGIVDAEPLDGRQAPAHRCLTNQEGRRSQLNAFQLGLPEFDATGQQRQGRDADTQQCRLGKRRLRVAVAEEPERSQFDHGPWKQTQRGSPSICNTMSRAVLRRDRECREPVRSALSALAQRRQGPGPRLARPVIALQQAQPGLERSAHRAVLREGEVRRVQAVWRSPPQRQHRSKLPSRSSPQPWQTHERPAAVASARKRCNSSRPRSRSSSWTIQTLG
jgi:hypothetical protein